MNRFDCQLAYPRSRARTPPEIGSPRPKKLRLHGTIARQLGTDIVSGRYAPGDLLDNEIVSSEQFAVSRTAYREAVRILAAKGLVDARPKVGTRVNPRSVVRPINFLISARCISNLRVRKGSWLA